MAPDSDAACSFYEKTLPKAGTQDAAVLDICSSWICHYPQNYKLGRIAGVHHFSFLQLL